MKGGTPRSRTLWTFAVTSLALVVVTLDNLVVTTALPVIRKDLGASIESLEWTVNAYTLTFAVLLLTGAALGDRFGRRRMFSIGLVIFTLASAGAALAPSIDALVAFRALQGVGGAIITPLTLTILSAAVPAEKRGVALGAWGGIGGLAVALGPLVGGAVVSGLSWQWIFWINVPLGVVLIPLALRRLDETHGPSGRLDLPGLGLASTGLLGIVWGLVRGNGQGWASTEVVGSLTAGAALVVAFVLWELRTETPMLPMRFFRNRTFTMTNIASLLMFFGMFGSIFLLRLLTSSIYDRYSWSLKGQTLRGSNVEHEPDPVPAAESQEGSHDLDRGAASRRHGVDRLARREARERGDRAGRVWLKELARARAGQGRRGVPARRGVRDHRRVARPALA
jgi:EmrB/QacA subfamily drug resistance transporter